MIALYVILGISGYAIMGFLVGKHIHNVLTTRNYRKRLASTPNPSKSLLEYYMVDTAEELAWKKVKSNNVDAEMFSAFGSFFWPIAIVVLVVWGIIIIASKPFGSLNKTWVSQAEKEILAQRQAKEDREKIQEAIKILKSNGVNVTGWEQLERSRSGSSSN